MILARSPKSGVENARIKKTANGIAVQSNQGRYFPHRVFVRSESMPTSGSTKASKRRATSNIIPAAVAFIPNTSV